MLQPSSAEVACSEVETEQVTSFLVDAGVLLADAEPQFLPLSGGVSSDIWLVRDGDYRVVVKTPLQRLRVQADWQAPLTRSDAEAGWLATASRLVPGICPEVLAYDSAQHLLALAYLDPAEHQVWKADLLRGHVVPEVAGQVGRSLGLLHRRAAAEPALAAEFAHEDLFRALRIEPYFESLFATHPDLVEPISVVIETTLNTRLTLVHGDASPKNILVGPEGPVLLDAETAHWGDPAFDVAFCLNHLLLKCLIPAAPMSALIESARLLIDEYVSASGAEHDLDSRVVRLLPLLLLARVDGRSPVEYLHEFDREVVRAFARSFILEPVDRSGDIFAAWKATFA